MDDKPTKISNKNPLLEERKGEHYNKKKMETKMEQIFEIKMQKLKDS
jgi:hypothetical protein